MSKSGARIIKAAGEAVLHAQVERLQADVARLTAERDAALALTAAAYEAAGVRARHLWYDSADADETELSIKNLTPADALAAQAARDERMRAEGRAEAETLIVELKHAIFWCGGSTDFSEGGQAREGWLKICMPLLGGSGQR